MNNKFFKNLLLWLLIVLTGVWLWNMSSKGQAVKNIGYSDFKMYLREGKVKSAVIETTSIKGEYVINGVQTKYRAIRIEDPNLVDDLEKANVNYKGQLERTWITNILFYFGPVVLFLFIWFLMIRQMSAGGKQAMMFGKSKSKLHVKSKTRTTFNDVAGCAECKEELQEIIEFLKNPKKFQRLGGKIPKGVLLYGAPGTGKTLLAKAVAGEADVPFFSSSGSEFVEMFVGVGASRVRDLFDKGRRHAPCLLFIDELDAVGRHRFAGIGGGHDEREQTLNQILVEMDGFETKEGVILIAATNRPDVLDPALLRPGRFDRQIVVMSPDIKEREAILEVHTRNIKLNKNVNLNVIARRTPGFVGSDLANICNEAALLAARDDKRSVEMKHMEKAVERIIAGPERKSRVISDKEKKTIAYHEAGHALVARLVPDGDPVHKVSIISRGRALGYTLQLPMHDKYLMGKKEIINKIIVLLGGRVSEELFVGDITTGAQNDLSEATALAQKLACEYGMSKKLGPLTYSKQEDQIFLGRDIARDRPFSGKTLEMIDEEIKQVIMDCYQKAQKYIEENKKTLNILVKKLVEKELIEKDELDDIFTKNLQ